MTASFLLVSTLLLSTTIADYYPPEQIHLSLGLSPDVMVFNWLTWDMDKTNSFVLIGETPHPKDFYLNITGESTIFTDCGSEHTTRTIHVATASNLKPSHLYYYQVGDIHHGYSDVYSFTTAPNAATSLTTLPHNFIFYGDMGTTNTQACGPVTEMVQNGEISAVFHVGDFAYNMYENNGSTGDQFMRDIQSMAANTPYMVAMGNHEVYYNFSHYTQRFRGQPLPSKTFGAPQSVSTQSGTAPNNWFYSFNYGLVHFISISSEIYFDFPWLISVQYSWLEQDLEQANKNRSAAPWIIAYHHRPLYCTGSGDECGSQTVTMRNGVRVNGGNYSYSLEEIYYKYGVDFVFNGHVHNYERVFDVYRGQTDQRTVNMSATTYIVNGDAGNREGHHEFENSNPEWSAYRTTSYSFSKFAVHNATHIHLQQITADSELPPSDQGKVLDDVWFEQHSHGPFEGKKKEQMKLKEIKKGVTYDPYKKYGIPMKVAPAENTTQVQWISNNKEDYRGIEGVYF